MEEIQNAADMAGTEAPCYPLEMPYLLVAITPPYNTLATGRELLAPVAHREATGRGIGPIAEAETAGSCLGPYIAMVDIDRNAIP